MINLALIIHLFVTSMSIGVTDFKGVSLLNNHGWFNNQLVVCWEAYDSIRKLGDYYYKGCYSTYKLKIPYKIGE